MIVDSTHVGTIGKEDITMLNPATQHVLCFLVSVALLVQARKFRGHRPRRQRKATRSEKCRKKPKWAVLNRQDKLFWGILLNLLKLLWQIIEWIINQLSKTCKLSQQYCWSENIRNAGCRSYLNLCPN